jgi:cobalt-zinc-cadmium efflux system outer membrane protein
MRRWFILIGLALVSGCVQFQPKPLSPSQMGGNLESRTLAYSGLRAFIQTNAPARAPSDWPPPTWNVSLLTVAALYYHPDMEVARAKLAAADAAVVSAGARPNPTLSFSPTYSEPPIEFFSPWTLGFTLDVPIETAGKRGFRIAQARHLGNAARLDVASAAWQVRSRIRNALLDLRAANLTAELLRQQQAAQGETVELMEDRLKAGQISLTDVQLVRVAAAQTALQLRDAQKQRNQSRVRLADALGVPVSALDEVHFSFAEFEKLPAFQDASGFRREALLNRADILGALAEYNASQSALQLEIAKQYPDINLGPGYTWNQGVNNYSLGISLTLPVLDQNKGRIAEAEAHRRQATAAFSALQARVIGEVDAALAGYRDALRKLETADTLVNNQRERMQAMQESLDAGATDRLEFLQTRLELGAAELSRTQAVIEAQQALGSLEDAVRRPIDK